MIKTDLTIQSQKKKTTNTTQAFKFLFQEPGEFNFDYLYFQPFSQASGPCPWNNTAYEETGEFKSWDAANNNVRQTITWINKRLSGTPSSFPSCRELNLEIINPVPSWHYRAVRAEKAILPAVVPLLDAIPKT
jgi:hypothetical protein